MRQVWAIVLDWRGASLTIRCVKSLLANAPVARVVVIDNGGGSENLAELEHELKSFETVEIIQSGTNLGYAGGMQLGVRKALANDAEFVWLLNNDCEVVSGSLEPLVEEMMLRPGTGACSGVIERRKDFPRYSGGASVRLVQGRVSQLLKDSIPSSRYEVDYMAGDAWLVRAEAIRQVGGLDCRLFLYCEEADWCYRARQQGWDIAVIPTSRIYAEGSPSSQNRVCEVHYYLFRNSTWLVRRQGSRLQRALHHFYLLSFRLPKMAAGLFIRGESKCLRLVVRGTWHGLRDPVHWSDDPDVAVQNRLPTLA